MNETDNASSTTQATCCGKSVEGSGDAFHCPMAEKFSKTLSSPELKAAFLLQGILLILIGVLILIEPDVLVWLAGGITIVFGLMFLFLAVSLKKFAAGLKH